LLNAAFPKRRALKADALMITAGYAYRIGYPAVLKKACKANEDKRLVAKVVTI